MPKLLIFSSNPRRNLDLEREVSDLITVVQRLGKFEIRLGLGARSTVARVTDRTSSQFVHYLKPIRKLELLSPRWLHKLDESSQGSSLVSSPTESTTAEIDSSTSVFALLPIASLCNSQYHE